MSSPNKRKADAEPPTKPPAKKKERKESKTKVPGTVFAKIQHAIRALKSPGGSSSQAIKKYCATEFK